MASLAAGRHVLLQGPPGTGKSTMLRAVADAAEVGIVFVEGNAELTPARLLGTHDPSRVLDGGWGPETFVDGPLLTAVREGALLYIEEFNRVPEDTLNLLVTALAEREVAVPRVGTITAAAGFLLVGAMNPFDDIGTARVSEAIADRCCRVAVGYQSARDETEVVVREAGPTPARVRERAVAVTRATRDHADVRVGSSVRGAIDAVLVTTQLAALRCVDPCDPDTGLDGVFAALTGRLQVRDGCSRTSEAIVRELWEAQLACEDQDQVLPEPDPDPASGGGSGKRPMPRISTSLVRHR